DALQVVHLALVARHLEHGPARDPFVLLGAVGGEALDVEGAGGGVLPGFQYVCHCIAPSRLGVSALPIDAPGVPHSGVARTRRGPRRSGGPCPVVLDAYPQGARLVSTMRRTFSG